MPTTPRRARLWLKAKQAHVVRKEPFTVQLCFETTTYTQPVTVGVDTGSKTVGIAAITNGAVVRSICPQRRDSWEEAVGGHATQTGTSSASRSGLDNHTATGFG